jgi:hypothetical protein
VEAGQTAGPAASLAVVRTVVSQNVATVTAEGLHLRTLHVGPLLRCDPCGSNSQCPPAHEWLVGDAQWHANVRWHL